MSTTRRMLLAAGVFAAAFAAPSLWACWDRGGQPVCTAIHDQEDHKTVSDGYGGAIIAWEDSRSGTDVDIYAQRIDGSGTVLWAVDGIPVCVETGDQYDLQIIADGTGGAIIVWRDYRSGFDPQIYAQRISSSGYKIWSSSGVAVCSYTDGMNIPRLVSDGSAGAIVVWESERADDYDIFAQRINSGGITQWTADGIAVCAAKGDQTGPRIISDGFDGAVVVWTDSRSLNKDIYVQRIDGDGDAQMTADGVAACESSGDQGNPSMVTDGDMGVIVAWEDQRSGNYDIYIQRVDYKGDAQWTAGGIALCSLPSDQRWPEIAADGADGAIVEWHDYRAANIDIYLQRVDATGSVMWAADGVAACQLTAQQYYMKIASDGDGGVYVTWNDSRSGDYDVYAQRVDGSGAVMWDAGGITLCGLLGGQQQPEIIANGSGGAIIAWMDLRDGDYDIYAQWISFYGIMTYYPLITDVADVPRDQGGKLEIVWNPSCHDEYPGTEVTHYSIWRRLSLPLMADSESGTAQAMPEIPLDFEGPAMRLTEEGYTWEWLANVPARYFESYAFLAESLYDSMGTDPGWQYFMVTAHTELQYVFYDSPVDSGYSVDNLSPSAPVGMEALQSYEPEGLMISWDENVEPDFHHYDVHRAADAGFDPSGGNLIASPIEASFFDGGWEWDAGYWYKIAAVDVHGNRSDLAVIGPENVTGEEPTPSPGEFFLAQNFPNPFNPLTEIEFGLARRGDVRLEVFDAAGRRVATLVNDTRPAGRYRVEWNGRDKCGNVVASGVYFYRLDAAGSVKVRKMVLLR